MDPLPHRLPEATSSTAAEPEPAASDVTDLVRLLRHFGVRALVLAFVSCLTGMTTVALCLTIAALVLLYAPVRAR